MPTRITRNEFLAGMLTAQGVQSATWPRRVNKNVKRCVVCNSETAIHEGENYCNICETFVATWSSREADKDEIVTMQFIPKINPRGTKNWTPVDGGQCFGVATKAEADEIKRNKGLVGVLKMSETETGDLRALPRVIPVFDVTHWKAEGNEYLIVD